MTNGDYWLRCQLPLQNRPRPGNILCDLGFEGGGVGEGALLAEPDEVGDPELFAVEIGLEIEDVDFERIDAVGGERGPATRARTA